MAKNLKEFLEECAGRDLRALRALQGAAESFCDGKKLIYASIAHKDGKIVNIAVPHSILTNAMRVAISGAGEAAKQIERTRPEVIKSYPDYPWIALKRLRDEYSHPTRAFLNGENQYIKPSIMRDWHKIWYYYRTTKPEERFRVNPNDYLLREIVGGWRTASALQTLGLAYRREASVPLTDNPVLQEIAIYQPKLPKVLPGIVAHYHMRHCLLGIGDAIEYSSVFLRNVWTLPDYSKSILALRNRAAHFADPPDHLAQTSNRNMSSDLLDLEPSVAILSKSLEKVPREKQSEASLAFSRQVAGLYYNEIIEKIAHDEKKLMLLDSTAHFISDSPKNSLHLQNAVVMAMANLLEVTNAEQGQEVLNYLKAKNGAIRNPTKMSTEITGVSHITKARLKQFLHEVEKLSKSIGEGVGRSA